jgi:hypothetical protein
MRGIVGKERIGKETDGCPLTILMLVKSRVCVVHAKSTSIF